MAVEIKIPKLGMTMSEAKLVQWRAKEGDRVEKGSSVLTIETEKITWEVEAVASGFLHRLVEAGSIAEVGSTVGLLAETLEELKAISEERPGAEAKQALRGLTVSAATEVQMDREGEFRPVSPAARRLAKELGVNLETVMGTGPEGRVTEADVERYHKEVPPSPKVSPLAKELAVQAGLDLSKIRGTGEGGKITKADVERALKPGGPGEEMKPVRSVPFTGMRKTIAENMYASLQKTAQMTTFVEVDVTEMVRYRDLIREEYKNDERVRISYNDILILATSRALMQFPMINSTLRDEEILLHDSVNMGIAVSVPNGLMVPVLRNADKKGLLQIAEESRELAQKAREGKLTVDDVTGGTFTVSNLSMFEVDGVTPILRYPETGILAAGRVIEKPAVYKDEIAIRSMMFLSLTTDHRVVDGAPASAFLQTVARFLRNPLLIMT